MDGQMRITVLGSSGQIGAYLSEYLSRKGHIVREFDIVNGIHQDMTHIPNTYLRNAIMESDFVSFLPLMLVVLGILKNINIHLIL